MVQERWWGICPGGYNDLADLEGQIVVPYLQMKKEVINPGIGSCMSLVLKQGIVGIQSGGFCLVV